jgi:hypothetical protein
MANSMVVVITSDTVSPTLAAEPAMDELNCLRTRAATFIYHNSVAAKVALPASQVINCIRGAKLVRDSSPYWDKAICIPGEKKLGAGSL